MSQRLIIDLRLPLRNFSRSLSQRIIPEYVIVEVINFVFDVLIYELENIHEEPDLTRLGNFYRDNLERDPVFQQQFLESFFALLKDVVSDLRGHGLYSGEGFEFRPERTNSKNRSIVVKKFDRD